MQLKKLISELRKYNKLVEQIPSKRWCLDGNKKVDVVDIIIIENAYNTEQEYFEEGGDCNRHMTQTTIEDFCDIDAECSLKNGYKLKTGSVLVQHTSTESSFGYHMAVKSGSKWWVNKYLATAITSRGFAAKEDGLYKDDILIPVRFEQDLFTILNMPWIKPENRI
jgi:hypothetical protein